MNQRLLAANQDLLSTNEELRTANEEFVLTAEAAQASTEEIETLNEEMQATNEELETLNEELQATIEELNTTNDELHARTVELQQVAQISEEERARLLVILNTMGDALLVLGRDGKPQLANAAYERLFGPSLEPFAVNDPEGRPMAPQETPHGRALAGLPFNMEFTRTNSEGQRRWFEASGRPILGANEQLVSSVLAIRDITDRSLHRMQEQFITLASHELRTPLTSLQGYLQMLDRQFIEHPLPDRARRYVTNALVSVDRLRRLIVDLLDAARLQNGKLSLARQPIALQPLVERAVDQARFLTTQELHLTATETPLFVNGDIGRLEQALLNLLSNAITHAPGPTRIDIWLRQEGSMAAIDVQDYGPGIAQSDLPSLFTRFYQAAQGTVGGRRGLGLGLFITHELVTAHQGTISVDTAEGRGSTFTIRLPLHEE
jgi:two-component system CheB/CheR fusion protein